MVRTQAPPSPPIDIRPAGPPDAKAITDFINGLSVRTQFLRFFAGVAPPSSGLLRGLCGAGGNADVVIAMQGGCVIGHAMAVDRADGDGALVSDIGLVVTDRWQQRGVGSALLRDVVARAAGRGADRLIMDVLPGNDRMLSIIDRYWPGARRESGADSITISAGLEPGIRARPERDNNDALAWAAGHPAA
jgi:GNAT superfamily N-acetyltransferase